jgi:hypothetical protein
VKKRKRRNEENMDSKKKIRTVRKNYGEKDRK